MSAARLPETSIEAARSADLPSILAARGVELRRQGARLVGLCPLHEERTPSFTVDPERGLWHCFGCGAGGDAIRLLELLDGLSFPDAVGALAGDGPGSRDVGARVASGSRRDRTSAPAARAPQRPPAGAVASLWDACRPVTEDPAVVAWLSGRDLSAEGDIERWHLARAIPPEEPLPSWARIGGRDWREAGYRLLIPLYDEAGRLASLRARRVVPGDSAKELVPAGFSPAGLVLADVLGQALLADLPRAAELVASIGLVVAEGGFDFLVWASRAELATATLGIFAGSWTVGLARRIPPCRVTIATDADEAGERYASEIARTLGHCERRRWRPRERVA